MRIIRSVLVRLGSTFRARSTNRDAIDELAAHVQFHIDDNVRAGMTPDEARRHALIELGGIEPTREHVRDRRGLRWLEQVLGDARYALRGFSRAPLFTGTVVLTLAVGSGVNAAIFSIFNQALLQTLPTPAPDRLVNLSSPGPRGGRTSTSSTFTSDAVFSYPLFTDLSRIQTPFTAIAAFRDFGANLAYRGQAWIDDGLLVSGTYFPVLRATPALGRLLDPEDDRTNGHVVVLAHAFWVNRFSANPGVLNEQLTVNGVPLTIVGVAPREFEGTVLEIRPHIFVPVTLADTLVPTIRANAEPAGTGGTPGSSRESRLEHWLYLFARLREGVSIEDARRQLAGPFAGLIVNVEFPAEQRSLTQAAWTAFKSRTLVIEPGAQGQRPERDELRSVFIILFAVTGVVVLIACANVANLLLARSAARTREMTIRLSLGAGRGRLVGQMLVETFLLAAAGGMASLLVARLTLIGLGALMTTVYAPLRFELDARMLLFAAALSLGMTLLCGVMPALLATARRDLQALLRGGAADAPSAGRFRTTIATLQLALSLALVVIAGLFAKSLANVSRVDVGMRIADVTTFSLAPELNGYTPQQSAAYFDRVSESVGAIPGVAALSTSTIRVLAGARSGTNVTVEGFTPGVDDRASSDSAQVGVDYFRTLGIPLRAGREFTAADTRGTAPVAIVNEAFTRKFGLGQDALGKHMRPGRGRPPNIEIVGVVGDTRYSQAKDAVQPQFFLPARQSARIGALNFYVRSSVPTDRLAAAIRTAVGAIDARIPIDNLRSVERQAADVHGLDRMMAVLAAGFAVLASVLAALGLYGVLAYNLTRRTREFGVRMALGASTGAISQIIFSEVGRMALVGGTLGIIAALAAGRLAASQLFEVPGYDVAVTVLAVVGVAIVAFAAGCIPAWRAARIDPAHALRSE